MELVIFHYHLQPGGVTGVIRQTVEALHGASGVVGTIRVVSGAVSDEVILPEGVIRETMPSIGYLSRQRLAEYAPPTPSGPEADLAGSGGADSGGPASGPVGQVSRRAVAEGALELSTRIARELLNRFGGKDRVWWVHNHHLGKNPAFTRALVEIASTRRDQPIVLHIHDFPESGRYGNLRVLADAGVTDMYPTGPNVHYVTINSRDREILLDAGVTPVTYLPNPVEAVGDTGPAPPGEAPSPPDAPPPGQARPPAEATPPGQARPPAELPPHEQATPLRDRLIDAYRSEFPRFGREDRIFLYPVRAIRRKNILEAALITMLQETPASLVVTLPGVSQAEKKYSAMVEHAFRDGTIPGLFGIGTSIDRFGIDFAELQSECDVIVSSSVQEGFGYQYIAPLLLGKPLIARRLEVMRDIEDLFDGYPHTWYERLLVPRETPSLSGPVSLLRFQYDERIDRLEGSLPTKVVDTLREAVAELLEGDTIEFSFLLPQMQYVVLRDIRQSESFRRDVGRLNAETLDLIEGTAAATPSPRRAAVEERFGYRRHADLLRKVLTSLEASIAPERRDTDRDAVSSTGANTAPEADTPGALTSAETILARFAEIGYQRLLYE